MARQKNVIAPEAKAMDKMMISRAQADKLWGDGQPFDLVRVETRLDTNNSTIIERMIAAGRDYLWAKAYVNHGEFMALVDRTANSHTYVLNCMRFADMYRNSAPVPNLGVRKTRALTLLDKPVVEEYLSGGSLGDIPHDDVSEMSVSQLEEEVRKLREKVKKTEAVVKERIRQKDEQIAKLELENENRQPPTKEQIAIAELAKLDSEYFQELTVAMSAMRTAVKILGRAQCVPGVNVQILNDWIGKYNDEMVLVTGVYEEFTGILDNLHPIAKGEYKDSIIDGEES